MNLNKYCHRCSISLDRDDITTKLKSDAYNVVFDVTKQWDRIDICDKCVEEIEIVTDTKEKESGLLRTKTRIQMRECEWCNNEMQCKEILSKQNEYAYICHSCYNNEEWDSEIFYALQDEPQCHFCSYKGLLVGEIVQEGKSLKYCDDCYRGYIKPNDLDVNNT
jgi:hypothetical protein